MKKITVLALCSLAYFTLWSCGGESQQTTEASPAVSEKAEEPAADPKGIGEIKEVTLTDPLQEPMIASGKAIYEMKCSGCHKLTDQRVVGPGWAGVTNRRRPEWIMNMITNVDVMLDEDPVAQEMLEECLTRMPNQGVSTGDARGILEYMRQNDLDQIGNKDMATKN